MVSLVGIAATLAAGSFAFRKLYEYYWKNPNINVLNSILKRKTTALRSLYIIFDKSTFNFSYSQHPASIKQQPITLLTSSILFKYLKRPKTCILYTNQFFSPWNTKQITNLLMNGIEPEIKKFLQINQYAFLNKNYYQMMKSMMEVQIQCQKVIPVVTEIEVEFEELMNDERDFLAFRKKGVRMENCFLVMSQEKERPKYRYSPYETTYDFISKQQLKKELEQGIILELWETKNDNPLYKVIKTVKLPDKQINLSDTIHQRNKPRLKNILASAQQFFPIKKIDF